MPEPPTSAERIIVPSGACDSHLHVYDGSRHAAGDIPADAGVRAYAALRSRFGFNRAVIVQPRPYGTDNSALVASIMALGSADTRGIAVLHPDVADRELELLHAEGIRGIRFSLFSSKNAVVTFDMVEPLAARVHELGWHVQLHWTAQQIVEQEPLLRRLSAPMVFDHMARLPLPAGPLHPAFAVVRALLDQGRAWVKLSGPYLQSVTGPKGDFRDVDSIAQAWIASAPHRVVWGSDWPQNDWRHKSPDGAHQKLLMALRRWVGNDEMMRRVLVDNPGALYGFDV